MKAKEVKNNRLLTRKELLDTKEFEGDDDWFILETVPAVEAQDIKTKEIIIKMLFPLIDELFTFACNGDYTNGNDANGLDEGRYMAGRRLDELEIEIKNVKLLYGIIIPAH